MRFATWVGELIDKATPPGYRWRQTKESNMLKALIAFAALAIFSTASFAACDVPSDRASDGSRCGKRAASERPGGR